VTENTSAPSGGAGPMAGQNRVQDASGARRIPTGTRRRCRIDPEGPAGNGGAL